MTTATLNYGNQVASYQRQEVITLSPGQLIEKLYSIGIKGCYEKDSSKVSRVLTELISSLDFTYKEIALGFYRIYEYCLRIVKAGKFEEVIGILKELEGAWKEATKDLY